MASFKQDGEDTNEYFIHNLPVNMDLSRLYVLTMRYSASASEATIIGLKPYLNVIQIGEPTHGKYYGGGLIRPMVYDRVKREWIVDKEIDNWLMYLMVYRYADKNGDVSFSGGLAPDIYAEEDYFPLYPLGDERDPLLGKAIEMITGQTPVQTRTKPILFPYTIDAAKLRSPLNGKMIHSGEIQWKIRN
jgi:C-terminal processing protease CtpA/Prc